MPEENATPPVESLGETLKQRRLENGLSIEQIASETKISASVVQAMEEEDSTKLPAPAFTKGFYNLYAKTIGLDPEHIQGLYEKGQGSTTTTKSRKTEEVGSFAHRPLVPIFSIIGFTILVLLVIGGTLTWYFSWNPAPFLSEKLRGVDSPAQELAVPILTHTIAPHTTERSHIATTDSVVVPPDAIAHTTSGIGIGIDELGALPTQLTFNTPPPSPLPQASFENPKPEITLQ